MRIGAAAVYTSAMRNPLGRWLREPALHFVLIGAGIFALHSWLAPAPPRDPRRVVVTPEFADELAAVQAARTGRALAPGEREALVAQWVDDEILVREALALGLHAGDPVVRRRLVQKMEFLLEDAAAQAPPSEAELQAWLDGHADRFREPERLSFRHVFFTGDGAPEDARVALAWLAAGRADPERLGDAFILASSFSRRSREQIAATFGADFADAVVRLAPGEWSQPVRSSFGLHLVRVSERVPGRVPALAEVRARVAAELQEERRRTARASALAALRNSYEVVRP